MYPTSQNSLLLTFGNGVISHLLPSTMANGDCSHSKRLSKSAQVYHFLFEGTGKISLITSCGRKKHAIMKEASFFLHNFLHTKQMQVRSST